MAFVFELRIVTLCVGNLKIMMIESQISSNHDHFFGSHPPCPETLDMDEDERRQKCLNVLKTLRSCCLCYKKVVINQT